MGRSAHVPLSEHDVLAAASGDRGAIKRASQLVSRPLRLGMPVR